MRNCFVPHCDAFCKKNGVLKRMMFSAPKDNFESWKKKLFNKREFRETDRVCERHFDRTQILTHWEHIIDGKVCQLEREKPKIKSNAVPYLNLPDTFYLATTAKKREAKVKPEPRKRKQNHTNPGNNEKAIKDGAQCEENNEWDTVAVFDVDTTESPKVQRINAKSQPNGVKTQDGLSDAEKRQIFDTVYDDIYEVVLPNTLWGIHRDPEDRQYIAFTMFDASAMNSAIAVKITDTFSAKVFANGVEKTSETLPELSVEVLTKLVNQLNESAEGVTDAKPSK
ncbi:uncharacterized protein LOC129567660 [Sitodiplosis mosellana]|uniref:uncharacterized protein LOC129567660 n=1 Tax=Sitodiplosis mosellana TaxID=263140 RepID=UPI002444069F|nr:uncharacterized protein LOC129567660 [Sitodiplosis mosellana]